MSVVNANWGYDGLMAVMAHEYGHHEQNLIGSSLVGVNRELQADCFAGATMRWMQRGFPNLSLALFQNQAYWSGDDPSNAPTHGLGPARSGTRTDGWNGSPEVCRVLFGEQPD